MITLNEIADAVHSNAVYKGFHPIGESTRIFVANQCNNIHAEVTELWDRWRDNTQHELCDKAEKMVELGLRPLTNTEEELADIIIRALDVSRRLDVNILEAIQIKHAYNLTRGHKHGKLN